VENEKEKVSEIKANEIVHELQKIRTSIDGFLSKLDKLVKLEKSESKAEGNFGKDNSNEDSNKQKKNDLEVSKGESNATANSASTTTNGVSSMIVNSDVHKEFDPLVSKFNDLDSSFKKSKIFL